MKKITFILLLAVTLSFCSRTKDLNYGSYPQKWQLVKMSGNMAGPENVRTGDAMEWQEFYILKADGTFKKSRKQYGQVTEAGGTYSIKKQSDGNYLELVYPSKNNLIGSCSAAPREVLFFNAKNKLISTWQACDGPGLEYENMK